MDHVVYGLCAAVPALRKAVDVIVGAAKSIPAEQARAREDLWTPEKEADEAASGQLWTPGSSAS